MGKNLADYPYGSVIIEEKGGHTTGENFLLVVFGVSTIGVALAVAVAVIQLSLAISVAVVAIGLGFGGSLGAQGLAKIILARGQAHALVLEARQRAELERERLALEKERLRLNRQVIPQQGLPSNDHGTTVWSPSRKKETLNIIE